MKLTRILIGIIVLVSTSPSLANTAPGLCESFYKQLVRTQNDEAALEVSLFIGHLDIEGKNGPYDYSPNFNDWLISRMIRPCTQQIKTGFCDFVDYGGSPKNLKKNHVTSGLKLNVVIHTVDDYHSDPHIKKEFKWLEELEQSVATKSATFVISHSRAGVGPDPFPQPGAIKWLIRRFWVDPFEYILRGLGKATNPHLLALNLCNADGIYSKRIEDYIKTENPQAVHPILLTARDQKYELQYYQILDLIEFVVGGMSTGICPDEIQARYTSRNSFEDPEKQNQYLWLPENIWNK